MVSNFDLSSVNVGRLDDSSCQQLSIISYLVKVEIEIGREKTHTMIGVSGQSLVIIGNSFYSNLLIETQVLHVHFSGAVLRTLQSAPLCQVFQKITVGYHWIRKTTCREDRIIK